MARIRLRACLIPVCLLAPITARADSAEDAWYRLVGERNSRRVAFHYVENNPDLPNVLLYGDSISMGYTHIVRNLLQGKANVYRIHCNGGESGSFIDKMTRMHDVMRDSALDGAWDFEWDVIHFNVGLHDLKYVHQGALDRENGTQVTTLEAYKKNLEAIVSYLKKIAPDAKLIFATTTPVPEGAAGRRAGDAARYNAAALEVLEKHPDIAVNDLFSPSLAHQSEWWRKPGDVHFSRQGQQAQGKQVAECILEALSTSSRLNP